MALITWNRKSRPWSGKVTFEPQKAELPQKAEIMHAGEDVGMDWCFFFTTHMDWWVKNHIKVVPSGNLLQFAIEHGDL